MSLVDAPSRALHRLGYFSALLYLFLGYMFWSDRIFDTSGQVRTALFVIVALLTAAYFAGMWFVRESGLRTVVMFAGLFAILGFVSGPTDSTDIFYYMAQGWEQSHYGSNPYSHVLRDLPQGMQDPMINSRWMALNRNPWRDEPMPYGFAFALIARGLTWIGHGNWWLTYALFAGLNLLAHIAVCVLLWLSASHIPSANPRLILYLYSWSPLVVFQYLGNLHNDLLMAALILTAFYFVLRGRFLWVIPTLVVAGLIKFLAFGLIPLALAYGIRRHGFRLTGKSALLGGLSAIVLSAPYLVEAHSFKFRDVVDQFNETSGSLHAFLTFAYRLMARPFRGSGEVDLVRFGLAVKFILWTAVGLFALFLFHRIWRIARPTPAEVMSGWTSLLFAVIFIGSSQFYSWYIGMLYPLALLGIGNTDAFTEAIVVLSGTHMLFTFVHGRAIGYFLLTTAIPVIAILWARRCERETLIAPLGHSFAGLRKPGTGVPEASRLKPKATAGLGPVRQIPQLRTARYIWAALESRMKGGME